MRRRVGAPGIWTRVTMPVRTVNERDPDRRRLRVSAPAVVGKSAGGSRRPVGQFGRLYSALFALDRADGE
jgi:hypothetical protein